jgi:hypothetical protein
MHRIDTATAVAALPAPAAPGPVPNGYWQPGNPQAGQPATGGDQDFFNMLQEELASILTAAGIAPVKGNFNQVLTSIVALVKSGYQGMSRTKLAAPLTLYVNAATGNDNNPGTLAQPFQTLQAAWNYIYEHIDANGQSVTISATGAFTAGISAYGIFPGTNAVNLVFTGASSITLAGGSQANGGQCIAAGFGAILVVSVAAGGSCVLSGGTYTNGIYAYDLGMVQFSGLNFGAFSSISDHITVNLGVVLFTGNYTISGGAGNHYSVGGEGGGLNSSSQGSIVVTLEGTPNFAGAFAEGSGPCFIGIPSSVVSYSGAATGSRYAASYGCLITTNGGGANFFPGNAAGSTVNGFYV